MKQVLVSLFLVLGMVMAAGPVKADGQYGGGSTSTSEEPREEVTHQTVEAGLADNLLILAGMVAGLSVIFYILSKVTARVYLLDK